MVGVLLLCRNVVGVFYSPSWLNSAFLKNLEMLIFTKLKVVVKEHKNCTVSPSRFISSLSLYIYIYICFPPSTYLFFFLSLSICSSVRRYCSICLSSSFPLAVILPMSHSVFTYKSVPEPLLFRTLSIMSLYSFLYPWTIQCHKMWLSFPKRFIWASFLEWDNVCKRVKCKNILVIFRIIYLCL